jgi:hypothetical protein
VALWILEYNCLEETMIEYPMIHFSEEVICVQNNHMHNAVESFAWALIIGSTASKHLAT